MPRGICAAYTCRPAPWSCRKTGSFMLHTPTSEATFSGMCALPLLLHIREGRIPRSPSSVSMAQPQLHYLIPQLFPLQWSPLCLKTRYMPRLPSGACSRGLRATKNVLVLLANCTLVIPKRAVRRQLHHANCFALLYLFILSPFSPNT